MFLIDDEAVDAWRGEMKSVISFDFIDLRRGIQRYLLFNLEFTVSLTNSFLGTNRLIGIETNEYNTFFFFMVVKHRLVS